MAVIMICGRHPGKYSIIRIESVTNEYIKFDTKFASLSCPCAEIW